MVEAKIERRFRTLIRLLADTTVGLECYLPWPLTPTGAQYITTGEVRTLRLLAIR